MISKVPDIGFDKLFLSGWQEQMKSAARDLQKPASDSTASTTSVSSAAKDLSLQEQQQLDDLVSTDRKVRAHEQAHLNVGRDLVLGGPTYTYTKGPDGRNYAIGGEVRIDTSPASTPQETIPKAQRIRATALAPADPSAQDRQVASTATSLEMSARVELAIAEREGAQAAEQQRATAQAIRTYETTQAGQASGGISVKA